MPVISGYQTRAAFHLRGLTTVGDVYPTGPFVSEGWVDNLGSFDLLPFTKESIVDGRDSVLHETLGGHAGYKESHLVSLRPGGSMDLAGQWSGLNQLIAAAFGYERCRSTTVLESPSYVQSGLGTVITGTASAGGSATSLVDTSKTFTTALIGDYVRTTELDVDTAIGFPRVYRITAVPDANTLTLIAMSQNAVLDEIDGVTYEIARVFRHVYECSKHMHMESANGFVDDSYWGTTDPGDFDQYSLARCGVLGIAKGPGVWEWQAVMVNGISFDLIGKGLSVSAELVPLCRDLRTTGRNSNPAVWTYHSSTYFSQKQVEFANSSFMIGTHAASDLDSGDAIGISNLKIQLKNNLKLDDQSTETGLYRVEPCRAGLREVTGSFDCPRYYNNNNIDRVDAKTLLMAHLQITGPAITGTDQSHALDFYLRSLELTKGTPTVDGGGVIKDSYEFRCLQPPSASGSTWPIPSDGADNSEIMIGITDTYPFNPYMGQNGYF
jgi:hypothetical protein